jgi:hypothetical protein
MSKEEINKMEQKIVSMEKEAIISSVGGIFSVFSTLEYVLAIPSLP